MKSLRLLSVILSILLLTAIVLPATAFAITPKYYVAGDHIFGNWEATKNEMTKGGDGKYTFSITTTQAESAVNFKVTNGSDEWYGDASGNNIIFDVKGAGEIVITFDPTTKAISISGSAYAEPVLSYSTVAVAGNGEGNFLNGESWNEKSTANMMTKVEDDVWEIEYKDVPAKNDWQFKFVLDSSWSVNFGGTFEENGKETNAVLNGNNIYINTASESNIKIRLDLKDFVLSSGTGAMFTVTVTPKNAEDMFYVVGTEPLAGWDKFAEENAMTADNDGVYSATFSSADKVGRIELKVVKLTGNDVTKKDWYGDADGNNVAFGLSEAGRFTVTYNTQTGEVKVTGDKVIEPAAAALQTGDNVVVYIGVSALVILALTVGIAFIRKRHCIEL